jgi:predicted component of type VI protein secretion system
MDAKLRVLSGPHAGETIDVINGKLLVGREEDCHLRPDSEFVSRHHCVLLLDEYTLRVRDLGSKNGTFVNGRRIGISETILLHDDMISIGEMICQVDLAQSAPPSLIETAGASFEMLHGTGVYDGDTVQAADSVVKPPGAASPPPVTTPFTMPEPSPADSGADEQNHASPGA